MGLAIVGDNFAARGFHRSNHQPNRCNDQAERHYATLLWKGHDGPRPRSQDAAKRGLRHRQNHPLNSGAVGFRFQEVGVSDRGVDGLGEVLVRRALSR